MAKRIIGVSARIVGVSAAFAVMLAGVGPLPPAGAGHMKVPSLAGLGNPERRTAAEPCRSMGLDHKIDYVTYALPNADWIRLYFKGKERNPFGIFDTRDETVYYDVDRDGHFDGKAAAGEFPVGGNWCDLLDNILRGKVKAVKP